MKTYTTERLKQAVKEIKIRKGRGLMPSRMFIDRKKEQVKKACRKTVDLKTYGLFYSLEIACTRLIKHHTY